MAPSPVDNPADRPAFLLRCRPISSAATWGGGTPGGLREDLATVGLLLRYAALLCDGSAMATVHLTRHLYSFFPSLEGKEIAVEAATVSEVVQALERAVPGIGFYICDERGRLRTHVNVFVDKQMIRDRRGLSDPVGVDSEVHILQALSGG